MGDLAVGILQESSSCLLLEAEEEDKKRQILAILIPLTGQEARQGILYPLVFQTKQEGSQLLILRDGRGYGM